MSRILITIFGMGNQEIFLVSCMIILIATIVWSILDLLSNKDLGLAPKLIWLAILSFFPILGTLFYLYYGRTEKHLSNNL